MTQRKMKILKLRCKESTPFLYQITLMNALETNV